MKKQEEVQGVQQALVIWKEVLALQLPAYNNANQNPIEIEAKNILLSFTTASTTSRTSYQTRVELEVYDKAFVTQINNEQQMLFQVAQRARFVGFRFEWWLAFGVSHMFCPYHRIQQCPCFVYCFTKSQTNYKFDLWRS